jgi:hypothetical protein
LLVLGVPNLAQAQRGDSDIPEVRRALRISGMSSLVLLLVAVNKTGAQDTPANIISDHIRRQGYACDEPRHAERDEEASRPNGAVWTLRCRNAKYRVTLIPDMAANVEVIK